MTLERPNAARDIDITEQVLRGQTITVLARRLGISKARILQVTAKVLQDMTHPSRLTEPMPAHDYWLLTEARKHADFWLRRIEAHKTFLRITTRRQVP